MIESLSALSTWTDRDFFSQGAFLTHSDQERVILGKGGTFQEVKSFLETSNPVFYLKDFYQDSYLAYIPDSYIELSRGAIQHWLKEQSDAHAPIGPYQNDDDLYQKDFELLQSKWNQGLEKVVMVSRETYEGFDGDRTLLRLLKKAFEFGTGQPYGLWNKQYGVIGSTPELLYKIEDEKLLTFALAGTAKQGEEEALLKSSKDRHEHDLVIKDISEKISPFVNDLFVHETEIHPYKSIVHLKTDIEAKVREKINFTQLTNSLSPTAALGGYPKVESLNFLKGTNYGRKYSDRYFGSCFGIVFNETVEFVVSIRNVQWENGALFIESGGGVVPESDYQKELEEIHLKRNTIRKHYL